VYLDIYWDLAGHFTRFDTLPGKPLTKYNHRDFTSRDYLKLHLTMSNENSILGEKSPDELLDKTRYRFSETTDAITGATAREMPSTIVEFEKIIEILKSGQPLVNSYIAKRMHSAILEN
jgi:hypothetical protein